MHVLLGRLVGTWGNSSGSLAPAELDESTKITALQGMLAMCATARHTFHVQRMSLIKGCGRENTERCADPKEKQMMAIQAWLNFQCKMRRSKQMNGNKQETETIIMRSRTAIRLCTRLGPGAIKHHFH